VRLLGEDTRVMPCLLRPILVRRALRGRSKAARSRPSGNAALEPAGLLKTRLFLCGLRYACVPHMHMSMRIYVRRVPHMHTCHTCICERERERARPYTCHTCICVIHLCLRPHTPLLVKASYTSACFACVPHMFMCTCIHA